MADFKSDWLSKINQNSYDTEEQCDVDTKPYLCDICGKAFILQIDLSTHYTIHTEKDKFICELCNVYFDDMFDLDFHSKSHSNTNALTCTCGKTFKSKTGISHHTKSLLEKKYICEVCSKCFCNKSLLKCHRDIHEGKKPYVCRICRKCFILHNEFLKHYRICRKNQNKASKLKDNLKPVPAEKQHSAHYLNGRKSQNKAPKLKGPVHAERQHSDSEFSDEISPDTLNFAKSRRKQFLCKFCKKTFELRETLHSHYHVFPDHKPFSCHICKAAFVKKHSLIKHYRFHTKEKPQVCDICSKGFFDKEALKEHIHYSHSK